MAPLGELSPPQLAFLAIILVAIAALVSERLRPDLVALLIILALAWTRILSPDEAFSGLKSEAAIVIAAMFVLSAGLTTTGLSAVAARWIGRVAGHTLGRMLAVLMPAVALASSITHHVTITAVMLPITVNLSRERKIPASRLLMPLAIASSLGTTITILGAPSFLISSELLRQAGRPGLGVFSIAPVGIVLTVLGTLYMLVVGRFLLPVRKGIDTETDHLRLSEYFTELRVLKDSPLVGHTVDELHADQKNQFRAVGLIHQGRQTAGPFSQRPLEAGDVLLVRTSADELASMRQEPGWELEPVVRYADRMGDDQHDQTTPGARDEEAELDKVVQAVVAPRSSLERRTIADVDFRRRYRTIVLGIWRRGRLVPTALSQIILREGDVLVLQANAEALARLANERDFLLLTPFRGEARRPRKAIQAGLIMLATVVGATLPQVGLGLSALTGATAMIVSRCLTARQAYRAIDVRMFIFVAGAIPLGKAMKETGTADVLAGWLRGVVTTWDMHLVLLSLFVVVGLVVQFMGSDSATVAVFGPVAIALAASLGHAPEPYLLTVAIAAVTAVLTPMSHHNLIIYAPGGYRFFDYARVGGPLTVLLGVATAVVGPLVWAG